MTGERERWATGDARRPPSIVSSQSIHVGYTWMRERTHASAPHAFATYAWAVNIRHTPYPKPQTSNFKHPALAEASAGRQTSNKKDECS